MQGAVVGIGQKRVVGLLLGPRDVHNGSMRRRPQAGRLTAFPVRVRAPALLMVARDSRGTRQRRTPLAGDSAGAVMRKDTEHGPNNGGESHILTIFRTHVAGKKGRQ